MGAFLIPGSLAAALAHRAHGAMILAGGTDYYPARVGRGAESVPRATLGINVLSELRGISSDATGVRIGAATTWTELAESGLPPAYDALRAAAREVGGRQIQNRGTIGGNLCNASPAADGVPPLLVLDASVELVSVRGRRIVPLCQFLTGPRRTALANDEILSAIIVPPIRGDARSAFVKLGARRYLLISIVMVAGVIEHEHGHVSSARIAVGACSAVALRLTELESRLAGRPLAPDLAALVSESDAELLAPIEDVRASADYRRDAAMVLVRRLLATLGAPA